MGEEVEGVREDNEQWWEGSMGEDSGGGCGSIVVEKGLE